MTTPHTPANEKERTAGDNATATADAKERTAERTTTADATERTTGETTPTGEDTTATAASFSADPARTTAEPVRTTADPAYSAEPDHSAEPVRTARRPLRTIADYDRHYHAKTGDDPTPPRGFARAYLPERGWCQYRHDSEAHLFLVWAVSGDGHFWHDWARATGLELGCTAIVTICSRPIRPYIRLWHWHIEHTETRGGKHRFHCRTADGRPVLITHKHTDPDGQDAYWVTEHLTERNDTHG